MDSGGRSSFGVARIEGEPDNYKGVNRCSWGTSITAPLTTGRNGATPRASDKQGGIILVSEPLIVEPPLPFGRRER
jgi:hypothetical protein